MAIQKFYPSFFQKAFRGAENFSANVDCTTLEVRIALFKDGAVFDKAHALATDIPDVETLVIESSAQDATIALDLNISEEKLYFSIPDASWNYEVDVNNPFRYAILFGDEGALIMHIDFESEQTPTGLFTLSSDESCKPHINLSFSPACP